MVLGATAAIALFEHGSTRWPLGLLVAMSRVIH